MEQSPLKDNQQESPSDSLAWLAGIIEGEGHLGMYKQHYKNTTRYVPRFCVVNTDVALMDCVAQILKKYSIGFHVHNRQRNERSKPTFEITIQGIKRLAKLLPLIIPYMRGKKLRNAKLLLDYVTWRMSVSYINGSGFDKDRAEGVYIQLRELNQTGILRDYTPVVLRVENDDIVRTAWRHAESQPTKESW